MWTFDGGEVSTMLSLQAFILFQSSVGSSYPEKSSSNDPFFFNVKIIYPCCILGNKNHGRFN
jgi:hypothetical protein